MREARDVAEKFEKSARKNLLNARANFTKKMDKGLLRLHRRRVVMMMGNQNENHVAAINFCRVFFLMCYTNISDVHPLKYTEINF